MQSSLSSRACNCRRCVARCRRSRVCFAFGHRLGYLPFDVARPLRLPALRDFLAARILDETDVLRMIALEGMPRNRAILLTLYAGGFRVSEACSLKWSDLQNRDGAGQITVFGKGGKTRTVLMPRSVWNALQSLRGDAGESNPVFRSRKGGHLDESQVWRIVRKASKRAGIEKAVSCHWLRHAHASHASTVAHRSILCRRHSAIRPSQRLGDTSTLVPRSRVRAICHRTSSGIASSRVISWENKRPIASPHRQTMGHRFLADNGDDLVGVPLNH